MARLARVSASISRTSGDAAFAQPEESPSIAVMENCARVCVWQANSPREFASANECAPVEKIPAAVCPLRLASAHNAATTRARSVGVAVAVASKYRRTGAEAPRGCGPAMGSKPGCFG